MKINANKFHPDLSPLVSASLGRAAPSHPLSAVQNLLPRRPTTGGLSYIKKLAQGGNVSKTAATQGHEMGYLPHASGFPHFAEGGPISTDEINAMIRNRNSSFNASTGITRPDTDFLSEPFNRPHYQKRERWPWNPTPVPGLQRAENTDIYEEDARRDLQKKSGLGMNSIKGSFDPSVQDKFMPLAERFKDMRWTDEIGDDAIGSIMGKRLPRSAESYQMRRDMDREAIVDSIFNMDNVRRGAVASATTFVPPLAMMKNAALAGKFAPSVFNVGRSMWTPTTSSGKALWRNMENFEPSKFRHAGAGFPLGFGINKATDGD